MKKKKIASVVGARPNFVKLAPIHECLKEEIDHFIIHTGQHYDFELSEIFFKEFRLPNPSINLEVGSGPPGFQVGEAIKKIEKILTDEKFEMVVVYGDTNSTFAGAFAAARNGIKVAHVEAGLRSFDRRMPEEINRILTDNISNYLYAPTETAITNLQNENIYGEVIFTGDLSVEIINEAKELARRSDILKRLCFNNKNYILFTMHRSENTELDSSFLSIIEAFELLKDKNFIFPLHPRTKKILDSKNLFKRLELLNNVKIIPPVGYVDFINLIQNAEKIVTDSGGAQKESYLLSIPCITIRKNTEWLETVTEGWNLLVDTDKNKIVNAINDWMPRSEHKELIFGNGDTSSLIKKSILRAI